MKVFTNEEGYQAQTGKSYNDGDGDSDDAVRQCQTKKLYAIISSNLFAVNLLLFTKGEKEVSAWLERKKTIFCLSVNYAVFQLYQI